MSKRRTKLLPAFCDERHHWSVGKQKKPNHVRPVSLKGIVRSTFQCSCGNNFACTLTDNVRQVCCPKCGAVLPSDLPISKSAKKRRNMQSRTGKTDKKRQKQKAWPE